MPALALVLCACPGPGQGSSTGGSGSSTSSGDPGEPTTDVDTPTTTGSTTGSTTDGSSSTTSPSSTSGPGTDTAGDTGTGEDGTSTGADTTTGGAEPESFACCEPGCSHALVVGHRSWSVPTLSGDRVLTAGDRVILWDRTTGERLWHTDTWTKGRIAGPIFYTYRDNGGMKWHDAADGSQLGQAVHSGAHGVASDGSYLWRSTDAGVSAFTADGVEIGFHAGAAAAVTAQALPGELRIAGLVPGKIVVLDLVADTTTELAYDGTFAGWFHESGRFWSSDGPFDRIHEADGSVLVDGIGSVALGANDLFLAGTSVRSIADPKVKLADVGTIRALGGDAILTDDARIVALTANGVEETSVTWPAYVQGFGHDDGHWVMTGIDGLVIDDADTRYTPGRFEWVDGAQTGRVAAASVLGRMHVWDVDFTCTALKTGEFPRDEAFHALADGGEFLVGPGPGPDMQTRGTQFLALPGGELVDFLAGGPPEIAVRVSNDATLFTRAWIGDLRGVYTRPGFGIWFESDDLGVMHVAPDGEHAAVVEAVGPLDRTHVLGEGGLIATLDGAAFGFLADDRLLIGRHVLENCQGLQCKVFTGADIVEPDGTLVQTTTLPDIGPFQRVSATELMVDDPPRIFDAFTGALLWSFDDVEHAAPLGADFVVTSDGGAVVARRWR